jgi:tetratricopeptide (TPR) repeat protein
MLRASDAATLNRRGLVHLKMNDVEGAMADYDSVLVVNPVMASALYGRGLAKQRSGDAAGAMTDMDAAKAIQADVASQFAQWGVTGKP